MHGPQALTRAMIIGLTAGMVWQFVLTMTLVAREQRTLRWSTVRDVLWLRSPRNPRTGRIGGRSWLVIVPVLVATAIEELIPTLPHPLSRAPHPGGSWASLRGMTKDHSRRKELGFLLLRFPAAITTFGVAMGALTALFIVVAAPFQARYGGRHRFGHWAGAARIEAVASGSPWSWALVSLGGVLLIAAVHLPRRKGRRVRAFGTCVARAGDPVHPDPGVPLGM